MAMWLPKGTLHRIQGDWALILDEHDNSQGGSDDAGAPPTVTVVPVSSLGVRLADKLPFLCLFGVRPRASMLVRVELHDVPTNMHTRLTDAMAAAAIGADDGDTSTSRDDSAIGRGRAAALRTGGPLGGRAAWASCRLISVLAWAFNLFVLGFGATFVLYTVLVLMADAGVEWALAVFGAFFLALCLSLVIADVLLAVIIATLPARSGRTESPLGLMMMYLIELAEID